MNMLPLTHSLTHSLTCVPVYLYTCTPVSTLLAVISRTILTASCAFPARWTITPFCSALRMNFSRYSSSCSITSTRTAWARCLLSRQSGRDSNAAMRPFTRRSALASRAICRVGLAREARMRFLNSVLFMVSFIDLCQCINHDHPVLPDHVRPSIPRL